MLHLVFILLILISLAYIEQFTFNESDIVYYNTYKFHLSVKKTKIIEN